MVRLCHSAKPSINLRFTRTAPGGVLYDCRVDDWVDNIEGDPLVTVGVNILDAELVSDLDVRNGELVRTCSCAIISHFGSRLTGEAVTARCGLGVD